MTLRKRWPITAVLAACLMLGMARDLRADEFAVLMQEPGMQGQFTQLITSADGDELGASEGHFALLRPHYFKWEIDSPGSQLIVTDGVYLWQYDRDLEVVVRRTVTDAGLSPLQLLALDVNALREHYEVLVLDNGLRLTPRASSAPFQQLDIVIEQGMPTRLDVIDNLDQHLAITLNIDSAAMPLPADFSFTPPDNVDLDILEDASQARADLD